MKHPHLHHHHHHRSDDDPDDRAADRAEDGQIYVDRSVVDFDPDDGLYTGTTVTGTSEIPGPHPASDAQPHADAQTHADESRNTASDDCG